MLVDIMMPNMDGYELCHLLRQDPVTESTPIFFLSVVPAYVQMENVDGDEEPEEYLTKPVDEVDLVEKIKTTLSFRSLH
jgi:putative two-component system response regulator